MTSASVGNSVGDVAKYLKFVCDNYTTHNTISHMSENPQIGLQSRLPDLVIWPDQSHLHPDQSLVQSTCLCTDSTSTLQPETHQLILQNEACVDAEMPVQPT